MSDYHSIIAFFVAFCEEKHTIHVPNFNYFILLEPFLGRLYTSYSKIKLEHLSRFTSLDTDKVSRNGGS